MKCTGKEWDHCRVEKMGCRGCYYDESKMNYQENDKKLIESANCKYYVFNEKIIENIIKKHIADITSEEWRTLIQMLYPKNMIGSGLFQPILIFKINKNGKRVDPPLEAYNNVNELVNNNCLIFRMMDHILKNSKLEFHNSWYETKDKIMKGE